MSYEIRRSMKGLEIVRRMRHEGVRMALGGVDRTRPYHPYKAVHDGNYKLPE